MAVGRCYRFLPDPAVTEEDIDYIINARMFQAFS
jgi:hypothetical protein